MNKYQDRQEAGAVLANALKQYAKDKNVIVLALPRGGVPVAFPVAKKLKAPLDVFIVRKLGVPGHEEFAMGALAMDGTIVLNETTIKNLNIPRSDIDHVIQMEQQELNRRNIKYRGGRPLPVLKHKKIILIDDGIATGATMQAAIMAIKKHQPARLIVAVPVAALDTIQILEPMVDELICPLRPLEFFAVGLWYETFNQTKDEEVIALLNNPSN